MTEPEDRPDVPAEAAPAEATLPVEAPAMETDTSLIVDCVKGSSPPGENTSFVQSDAIEP